MLFMPNAWIRPSAITALQFKYIDSLILYVRAGTVGRGGREEGGMDRLKACVTLGSSAEHAWKLKR